MFYVYTHDKLIEGRWVPFYVGKGKGGRAYEKSRNNWHNRVVAKYKTRTSIWQDRLVEQEAFAQEKELIEFLREEGFELTNMTDGGEGPTGYRHTEDAKRAIGEKSRAWVRPKSLGEKISKKQQGHNNSAKKPGVGAKISEALLGRVWVTNGRVDKQIHLNDIPEGWHLGRSAGTSGDRSKFIGCTKGLFWITNGASSKRVANGTVIPSGWRKGRSTPWQ